MIHVCSLARLHATVEETGARRIVTLMRDVELVRRPTTIEHADHLLLRFDDISEPLDGYTVPGEEHVAELLTFVRKARGAEGHAGGAVRLDECREQGTVVDLVVAGNLDATA